MRATEQSKPWPLTKQGHLPAWADQDGWSALWAQYLTLSIIDQAAVLAWCCSTKAELAILWALISRHRNYGDPYPCTWENTAAADVLRENKGLIKCSRQSIHDTVPELVKAEVILTQGIGQGRVAKMIINWPGLATVFEDTEYPPLSFLRLNLVAQNAAQAAVLSYLWPQHVDDPQRFETATGGNVQKAFASIFTDQICKRRINLAKRTLVQKSQIETDGRGFRITTAVDDHLDRWMAVPDYAGTQA